MQCWAIQSIGLFRRHLWNLIDDRKRTVRENYWFINFAVFGDYQLFVRALLELHVENLTLRLHDLVKEFARIAIVELDGIAAGGEDEVRIEWEEFLARGRVTWCCWLELWTIKVPETKVAITMTTYKELTWSFYCQWWNRRVSIFELWDLFAWLKIPCFYNRLLATWDNKYIACTSVDTARHLDVKHWLAMALECLDALLLS